MKDLHHAALTRAYRTLAQGLGGSALSVALIAIFTDGNAAVPAITAAGGTVLIASFTSFWQGVARGLPESADPPQNGLPHSKHNGLGRHVRGDNV